VKKKKKSPDMEDLDLVAMCNAVFGATHMRKQGQRQLPSQIVVELGWRCYGNLCNREIIQEQPDTRKSLRWYLHDIQVGITQVHPSLHPSSCDPSKP
jgi:hypothetical protein